MSATARIFDALGDPVRRGILELVSGGERSAGDLVEGVRERAPISQPAVSQHLKVLRDAGLVAVRADGTRRIYSVGGEAMRDVDAWLDRFRAFWGHKLDALATEVARGKLRRRRATRR